MEEYSLIENLKGNMKKIYCMEINLKKHFCLLLGFLFFFFTAFPLPVMAFDEAVIEGLHLEKIAAGKKMYSIEARKASFGNKAIGFFTSALIKVINLEDVYFTLYDDSHIIKAKHFNKAVFEINTKRLLDEDGNLIFCE